VLAVLFWELKASLVAWTWRPRHRYCSFDPQFFIIRYWSQNPILDRTLPLKSLCTTSLFRRKINNFIHCTFKYIKIKQVTVPPFKKPVHDLSFFKEQNSYGNLFHWDLLEVNDTGRPRRSTSDFLAVVRIITVPTVCQKITFSYNKQCSKPSNI
jgi:hypothetical protein